MSSRNVKEIKNVMTNKNKRIQQLQKDEKAPKKSGAIPDIEVVVQAESKVVATFFSPLQTRKQRINNLRPLGESLLARTKAKSVSPISKPEIKLETAAKPKEKSIKSKSVSPEKRSNEWTPKNWKQILDNIRKMRASEVAPVDTMGCNKCSDDSADEKTQRFQKLVALMLSSQTKDETTFAAMERLKAEGLTPTKIIEMKASDLENLIKPVSFYKNKAKYLQQTSKILVEKYDGDIPNNIKDLIALPGVGPKMAHICMDTAWNETTGIGVDVHVHRIANRLHFVPKATKEPEQTRQALEAWMPKELWSEFNYLLVGFGQTVCAPVRPHCGDCLNREICPSAEKVSASKKKREISKADVEGENKIDILPIKKAKFQKKKLQL